MASHAPRLVLVACALVAGCRSSSSRELREWQLSVDGQAASPRSVVLPTRLDDGRVPAQTGRYRLHHQVTLPAAWRGRSLQLVLPDLAAVAQLQVDGADAPDLSSSRKDGYRRRGPHAWSISPAATEDGVLDLTLIVEHTWTQSAWWGTVPRLLPLDESDTAATTVYGFNLVASIAALIALFQIALASLMIYLADRRRRVYLPFAVQGIIAVFYPLFVAGWTQPLLGVYDVPGLAITLALACTISIHFTHDFFRLERPPWRGFWWLCGAVVLVAMIFSGPFVATRISGIVTICFVLIVMVYQLTTCARLVRRGVDRRSALYSLASWIILAITGLPDFMWWLGYGDLLGGVRLASIGLALFAVCLSLLLSQKHVHSLRDSDSLNAELAERVRQLELRRTEIELLNEELRRQIADRAAQIYAAVELSTTRSVTASLREGEIIQGRYRVERPIGAGGMGTIYEVTRVSDGRRFALKLPQEVHGESLARLAREAQMASTLSHQNVVAVVDVDVASAGFLFLVMELVEGTSLQAHRDRYGNVAWALPVLHQVADGLTALHNVGIVHRDLKPGNILITPHPDGSFGVKISDFGIALNPDLEQLAASRIDASADVEMPTTPLPGPISERPTKQLPARRPPNLASSSFLTRTGQVPGTPLYMAPELADGRVVITPAADIFAFGVIAHELLTGRRPFAEPPVFALLERRACPLPRSIDEGWPAAPRELSQALDACLSLNVGSRPSAEHLARLFASLSGGVTG